MSNKFVYLCLLTLCLPLTAMADLSSPIGAWKTIDDVSGKIKALVEIRPVGGELQGRILHVFNEPGEDPNPVCNKCTDDRHGQPVNGMTIITGLHADGDVYDGGYILDPDSGTLYRAKIHLINGGQQLEVRGYIGLSLFGRTQVWQRASQ